MKKFIFVFLFCFVSSPILAQGYDGLIAASKSNTAPAATQDGYSGVVAWPKSSSGTTVSGNDIYSYVGKAKGNAQDAANERAAKIRADVERRRAARRAETTRLNLEIQEKARIAREEQLKKQAQP